jgi:hypothetical protein
MNPPQIPAGITALGPDVTARVQALVADAETRQVAEADAALDSALRIVPRPLRGVVRKVLLG